MRGEEEHEKGKAGRGERDREQNFISFMYYSLEKEMATHSSTLASKIPWTEEPGGLQSMGSQRVGHD